MDKALRIALDYFADETGKSLLWGSLSGKGQHSTPIGMATILQEVEELGTLIEAFPDSTAFGLSDPRFPYELTDLLRSVQTKAEALAGDPTKKALVAESQAISQKAAGILGMMQTRGLSVRLPENYIQDRLAAASKK